MFGCIFGHDWTPWELEKGWSKHTANAYRYCRRCHAEGEKSFLDVNREQRIASFFTADDRIRELEQENQRLDGKLRELGVDP